MALTLTGRKAPYRVDSELGSGGVGVVYAGTSLKTGQKVAIKVLRKEQADADTRRRFEQEAALGASFSHPNVVSVVDTGVHDGSAFMVMDLVEGDTLEDILRRNAIPTQSGVILVGRLARALDAAHRHGIVHRDVKPSNVIVTPMGEPVLMDFGFAKDLTSGMDLTGEWVVGTPNFMAPEQVEKRPITPRVDIHALGVLLYAIATKQLPYHGKDVQEAFDLILRSTPIAPRKLAPGLSTELEKIILRCLEKDPARRYATAAELAAELEGVVARRLAGTVSAAHTKAPPPPRSGLVLALGGAALAALLLAIGFVVLRGTSTPPDTAPPPATSTPSPPSPPPPPPAPPRIFEKPPPSVEEIVKNANEEIDGFHTREAVAYLESAARTHRSAAIQKTLARALLHVGRHTDALQAAATALELDPSSQTPSVKSAA